MVAELQSPIREQMAFLERPLTEADFWELPDDENRYEIILGELYVAPPPSMRHEDISVELLVAIRDVIHRQRLGKVYSAPVGIKLADSTIVQPDLVYVSAVRREIVREQLIVGTPDLVMEILSPSDRRHDLVKKRVVYQTLSVPEYWIVDPKNESIEVLTLVGAQYEPIPMSDGVARSKVLPALRIVAADLFASLW